MTDQVLPALNYPDCIDGLDVSSVQGKIDWQKVAAAGFKFAIVKASEGRLYCDPRALEYLAGARAAGLITSVYCFARPSQGAPREQVERLWNCMGDTMPGFSPVLDLEGAPDDWTPAQIVAFGEEFNDEIEHRFGKSCIVYTYPWFEKNRLQPALAKSEALARTALWMAHYKSTTEPWVPPPGFVPYTPKPWTRCTLQQYSGNGGYRVPGVPWDVDRNLFFGDEAAFRAFRGLPPELPSDPEPIVRPRVPLGRPSLDD